MVADQKSTLENLTDRCMQIEAANKAQEDLLQRRRLKNAELDSLKKMGLGLREFKILHSLIVELATENGKSTENGDAVKNFISDVENHHYDYIRLRKAVEDLKNRQELFIALTSKQSRLSKAIDALLRKKGTTDEDVSNIIDIMELYTSEDTSSADPLVYSDGDQNKVEKNQSSQVGVREISEPNKLAEPVAQDAKVSQLIDAKSNMNHAQNEYEADFEKILRSPEQVTEGESIMGNDSSIGTPNPPLADGNKHHKLGKPRYPHPLPSRKSLHREHYETASAKRREGQVRASLVTPLDNTDKILLKPIGKGTDSYVDVGHDESSSKHQSSHNTSSIGEKTVVGPMPEGSESFKLERNITEMMNIAMGQRR